MKLVTSFVLVAVLSTYSTIPALADDKDGGSSVLAGRNGVRLKAWEKNSEKGNSKRNKSPRSSFRNAGTPASTAKPRKAKCVERVMGKCFARSNGIQLIAPPAAPNAPAAGPALDPQVVAYQAVAQLKLTAPKPMIGPPPDINRWKMAAVGYPLWLWAEGDLDPPAVTDNVAGLAVALDARLIKVSYDMGDGNTVVCTDVSRPWTRSVAPGAASPVCGHRYERPSLPRGKYAITAEAEWAVDWRINGAGGTLPFFQTASTELPVGELQVLVR